MTALNIFLLHNALGLSLGIRAIIGVGISAWALAIDKNASLLISYGR